MKARQESRFAHFLKKNIKQITTIEFAYIALLLIGCVIEWALDSHPQNKYQDIVKVLSLCNIGLTIAAPLLLIQLCILLYYRIGIKWKAINFLLILLCPFTFFLYLVIIAASFFSKPIPQVYEKSHYTFLEKAISVDSLEIIDADSMYFYKSFILPKTKKKVAIALSHFQYRNRTSLYLDLYLLDKGEWIRQGWQHVQEYNNEKLEVEYKDLNFDNSPDLSIIQIDTEQKRREQLFIINWNEYAIMPAILKDNTAEYTLNKDSTLTADYYFVSKEDQAIKKFSAKYYWHSYKLKPVRIMKGTPEFKDFENQATIKLATAQQMHLLYLQKKGISTQDQQSIFLYCEEGDYIFGVNKASKMNTFRSLSVNLHSGKTEELWDND